MSRVIKFRAWDGEQMDYSPTFEECSFGGSYVNSFNSKDEKRTFMQFTGLLDKNGKEIYEGDVVALNVHGGRPAFEVVFEKASFQLKSQYALRPAYEWVDELDEPEVIGNRFENPGLLADKSV